MKKHLILFVALLFAISGCAATNKAGENPVERMVDDSTITTRINHEMVKDEVVKARQIDVDTIGGHVTLTGVVGTRKESARAVKIAQGVAGVKSVSNNLQIGERSYGNIWDDNLISNKIKAKLIAEPEVRSLNIDVDVYLGVVTLTGIVGSKYQKDRAIALSRSTDGTVKVIDNLKVQ
ncbi:MAG: BON domain-containing protein [Desulfobacterales bacterium]|jgi:hyperosmotically inducible protein|nr:BON domain-containing protein [Desulfobacterales bacterium]